MMKPVMKTVMNPVTNTVIVTALHPPHPSPERKRAGPEY